jgi:hypothetical protein
MVNKIILAAGATGVVGALLYIKGKYAEHYANELSSFKKYEKSSESEYVYVSGPIQTDNPVVAQTSNKEKNMVVSHTKSFKVEYIPYLSAPFVNMTDISNRSKSIRIGNHRHNQRYFETCKLLTDTGVQKATDITLDGIDITNITDQLDLPLIEQYNVPFFPQNNNIRVGIGSYGKYDPMLSTHTYGIRVGDQYTICGKIKDDQFVPDNLIIIPNCSNLKDYIENKKLDGFMYKTGSTMFSIISFCLFLSKSL